MHSCVTKVDLRVQTSYTKKILRYEFEQKLEIIHTNLYNQN